MSTEMQEFTYEEVNAHNSKKDLWVVIDGRVYDVSAFVDEHPGGEEVLLDVAGQDSTEAFDDVGHSDEAREILQTLLKGHLKGGITKSSNKQSAANNSNSSSSDSSASLYIALVAGVLLAAGAYWYLQVLNPGAVKA